MFVESESLAFFPKGEFKCDFMPVFLISPELAQIDSGCLEFDGVRW